MIETNSFGIASVFLIHTIALSLLCPPRYNLPKLITIWSIFMAACALFAVLILTRSPNYIGAAIVMCVTAFLYALASFFLSAYKVPKMLFLFLTYLHAYMVILYIAHFIPHFFFNDSQWISVAIRTTLHIALTIVAFFLIRRKFVVISYNITRGWWPLNAVISLLFINMCILLVRTYADPFDWAEFLPFLLLLVISVAVYWLFFHIIRYMHDIAESQMLELKSEFLMQQVAAMQESLENAKRLRHDARHHCLQVAEYVRNHELEALAEYLHQYEEDLQEPLAVRLCENLAANNILSAYARKAKQNGIDVNFRVTMEQNIGIKDTDIVAILANVMENAILGCIHSKNPKQFIDLSIERKVNKLVIQSRNTADADMCFENGHPRSNRNARAEGEGIGIPSILYSTKNYGGEADFQVENGVFICRVLLKIPKEAVL